MATLIGILFLLAILGYVAHVVFDVLAALWLYGLVAVGVLTLLVLSTHH
jgi:hypothetical protein